MADSYSAKGDQNLAASAITVLEIHAVTGHLHRARLREVIVGSDDTPADVAYELTCQRTTAAGTATAVTPTALDAGAPAAYLTCGKNHTAEPTYTASTELLTLQSNLRTSQRWVAAPGFELIIPATNLAGIGGKVIHGSSTAEVSATFMWVE